MFRTWGNSYEVVFHEIEDVEVVTRTRLSRLHARETNRSLNTSSYVLLCGPDAMVVSSASGQDSRYIAPALSQVRVPLRCSKGRGAPRGGEHARSQGDPHIEDEAQSARPPVRLHDPGGALGERGPHRGEIRFPCRAQARPRVQRQEVVLRLEAVMELQYEEGGSRQHHLRGAEQL